MYSTRHGSVIWLMVVSFITVGLLSGCGEQIAAPKLPTTAQEVEQGIKEIGDKANEQFKKIVNGDLPLEEQFDKLAAESKDLYCKAEGSEAAQAVKDAAQAAWDQLIKDNPGAPTDQLDLDPKMCAK